MHGKPGSFDVRDLVISCSSRLVNISAYKRRFPSAGTCSVEWNGSFLRSERASASEALCSAKIPTTGSQTSKAKGFSFCPVSELCVQLVLIMVFEYVAYLK